MRKIPNLMAAAGVLSLAACNWGTRPHTFTPAVTPQGARVAIRFAGENTDRVGELYAVDSTGVILRGVLLVHVPWTHVQALDVDKLSHNYDIRAGERVSPEKRARLAAVSRFPQGLSGDLLRRVLQQLGQQELRKLGRPTPPDSIAQMAETSAARYRDRQRAIADGYRRVGGDFPGMGEHWVHPVRVYDADSLDASRPSLLTYATIEGEARLLGVGFIATTGQDGDGSSLPGWPDVWHEHSGLLSEESGAHTGAPRRNDSGSRVWVLHVWTALPNPDGRYSADNWALPFIRAGVKPTSGVEAKAGRALSLVVDGDRFLRDLLTDAKLRTSETAGAVDAAIAAARQRSLVVADRARGGDVVAGDLAELRQVWDELTVALERALGSPVVGLLRPAHAQGVREVSGGHGHAKHR